MWKYVVLSIIVFVLVVIFIVRPIVSYFNKPEPLPDRGRVEWRLEDIKDIIDELQKEKQETEDKLKQPHSDHLVSKNRKVIIALCWLIGC